jgi:uncharacterized membrane protein
MSTNKVYRRALFSVIILAALVIRLFLILERAPAGDEIWGLFLAEASYKDIWLGTLADAILPLFYFFLRTFSLFLGFPLSIFGLRLISLFFGILAAISIGYLAYFVLGRRVGMIAFVLSLFLPASIWSAIYARYYSFLIFLTSLVMVLFIRFLRTRNYRNLIFLTGLSVVGVYTHHYFFLLILSLGAYLFLAKKSRKLINGWFLSVVSVSILFVPALFYFLSLPKPQIWMSNSIFKIPAFFLSNIVSFETLLFVYRQQLSFFSLAFFAFFLVVVVGLIVKGLRGWKTDLWLLFLVVIFLPPIVLLPVSYLVKPVFGLNPLLIFLPFYIVILARGIDLDLEKRKIFSITFLVLVFLSLLLFFQSSFWRSIFIQPFQFVKGEFEENDLVLHTDMYSFIQAKYYLKKEVHFGVIPTTYAPQTEKALGYKLISQEAVWQHRGRIWYFEPEYYNVAEAQAFKDQLDKNLVFIKKEIFRDSLMTVHLFSGPGS